MRANGLGLLLSLVLSSLLNDELANLKAEDESRHQGSSYHSWSLSQNAQRGTYIETAKAVVLHKSFRNVVSYRAEFRVSVNDVVRAVGALIGSFELILGNHDARP